MPEIKEKVNEFETLLGRFIVRTDIAITRLSQEYKLTYKLFHIK